MAPGRDESADDARYTAVRSRDRRFDGIFVTGVRSTGIYCRPSCPARTPLRRNVSFFTEAAGAEAAGFRACRRCRPELAPDAPDVDVRGDLLGRALRVIDGGGGGSVAALAAQLHVSERQLLRVFTDELGVGPLAVARARRVKLARGLLESSTVAVADVAFATGFGSVRQFNDAVRASTGLTPTQLRATRQPRETGLTLRLTWRGPYDTQAMLAWLRGHAVPGVEEVVGEVWRRSVDGGVVEVSPGRDHWLLRADLEEPRSLAPVVRGIRRTLDLGADPAAVAEVLSADERLRPLVSARPGLRCLGAFEPFEGIVRVIVGQQVSVRGGAAFAGRLARAVGSPLRHPAGGLTHVFPTAEQVAEGDLAPAGLTRARTDTLRRVAVAVAEGAVPLDGSATTAEVLEALGGLRGIGPWTLSCVALRVLRDPDAWPAGDLILRRACLRHGIDPDHDAPAFAPWRAYAATHLWEDQWTPPV